MNGKILGGYNYTVMHKLLAPSISANAVFLKITLAKIKLDCRQTNPKRLHGLAR